MTTLTRQIDGEAMRFKCALCGEYESPERMAMTAHVAAKHGDAPLPSLYWILEQSEKVAQLSSALARVTELEAALKAAKGALTEIARGVFERQRATGDRRADWQLAQEALEKLAALAPSTGAGKGGGG